jgi:hypothetical protein
MTWHFVDQPYVRFFFGKNPTLFGHCPHDYRLLLEGTTTPGRGSRVRAGQAHHGDHLQQNFMHGFSGEQCMHGLMTSMDSLANSANNCMHGLFSVKLFRCICGQSDIFFLLLDHIVATCYSKCVASANFILLVD